MAIGPKELQRRALREALASKSSDGGVEGNAERKSWKAGCSAPKGGHLGKQLLVSEARPAISGSGIPDEIRQVGIKPGPSEAKKGRPRIEVAHKTLAATKPWSSQGMSERTWFRRQAERKVKT